MRRLILWLTAITTVVVLLIALGVYLNLMFQLLDRAGEEAAHLA